jgi:hypothetical protein
VPAPTQVFVPLTDAEYHAWMAEHPHGFVLNTDRPPRPSYMVLHRAGCSHISVHSNPGAFTEHMYQKVCADTVDDLRRWTSQHGRPDADFSDHCRRCSPGAGAPAV